MRGFCVGEYAGFNLLGYSLLGKVSKRLLDRQTEDGKRPIQPRGASTRGAGITQCAKTHTYAHKPPVFSRFICRVLTKRLAIWCCRRSDSRLITALIDKTLKKTL
jgi:hypothetical protein